MIIKVSQRGGVASLSSHLLNTRDNERVRVTRSRGLFVSTLQDSLEDMAAIANATKCKKFLFHSVLNPAKDLTESEWFEAWQVFEAEMQLTNQPYVEVEHRKTGKGQDQSRTHRHRVYSRILMPECKALTLSHTKIRGDKVARILEHRLGEPYTHTKHHKAILNRLWSENSAVAAWMEAQQPAQRPTPVAQRNHQEQQQAERTGITVADIQRALQDAWHLALTQVESGRVFQELIIKKGLILARGRRPYVVVDAQGGLHSLPKRLGLKTKAVRPKLADLGAEELPTVEAVKDALRGNTSAVASLQAPSPYEIPAAARWMSLFLEAQR